MDTKAIIRTALFTPTSRGWGLPILLWGPPGVGKSDIIEELGAEHGFVTEILSPGERGEGAFGVIPVPERDDHGAMSIAYPPPDWARRMMATRGQRGLVFVDELTTAPPIVQPALLGLIQAKRIGATQLPDGVRVIGAANPPAQAAGGWELPAPVANRLGHVQWAPPTLEAWTTWLLGDQTEKEPVRAASDLESHVMAAWDGAYARAKGSVASFLRNRPELLHKMPSIDSPQVSRAWPSHRSWANATRAHAAAHVHGLNEEERDALVGGYIGIGAYAEFAAYSTKLDLPDPVELLEGRVKFEPDSSRIDVTFAVLSACSAVILSTESSAPTYEKRSSSFWKLLNAIGMDQIDIVIPAASAVIRSPAARHKEAIPVLGRIGPILRQVGIV